MILTPQKMSLHDRGASLLHWENDLALRWIIHSHDKFIDLTMKDYHKYFFFFIPEASPPQLQVTSAA